MTDRLSEIKKLADLSNLDAYPHSNSTARLIGEHVPWLVAEVERLRAENARLQARIDAAVKLTDTGSEEFKRAFPYASASGSYVAAWRVVEKIREVLQP